MKRWLLGAAWVVCVIWVVGNICTGVLLDQFIFQGSPLPSDYTFQSDRPFEEVFIERPDGMINGLYFPGDQAVGAVLFFHGNRRSAQRWQSVADRFNALGYAVFIPDYRGYGKSTGDLSEKIFYEDAMVCYQWLNERWTASKITVYGRSLGSAAACFVAAHARCRMLILETPFYSIPDVFYSYVPILPRVFFFGYEFHNGNLVEATDCPVIVIAAGNDNVVPVSSALRIKDHFKEGDKLWVIAEGSHNNLASFNEYHTILASALDVK